MKTINTFIEELQCISSNKRDLPLEVICPNGLQSSPQIKMQTKDDIPIIAGGEITKMIITYE